MYTPLNNTFVIGLGYKARNGKGTTADVFLDYLGGAAREYAFADALKSYCRVARGMTQKDAPLLQQVGTDEFRAKDPEVWTRAAYYTVAEKAPRVAIFSDVRFLNEAQMVKDMGGVLVQCVRMKSNGHQYIDPSRPADHPSETQLDGYVGWDYHLEADSLASLHYLAHLLIEHICEEHVPDLYKGPVPDEYTTNFGVYL